MKDRSVDGEGRVGSANLAWLECLHIMMIGFCGSWDVCLENFIEHEAATSSYKSQCCNMHLRCVSKCGNL
jgi:hypothetical protein